MINNSVILNKLKEMKINEFHNSARQLMNIGQGQYMPPEDIDLQINNAINDFFRQEYKHFEATQEISDTLGFYKTYTDPIDLDVDQLADIPEDLHYITGVEGYLEDDTIVEIEVLKDGHWLKRKHSKGFGPSSVYPIARQIGSLKLEALPVTIKKVKIYYLRKPAVAKYNYTVDGSGTGFIYNETGSVQVDYPSIGHPQIQDKTLTLLGLALRDEPLMRNESVRKQLNEDA